MSTEGVNERSRHIDEMSTIDMIRVINQEDYTVAQCVEQAIPQISAVVDAIYERMRRGGRLIYIGAGTSGRLAVQDAAECTVTYGVPKGTVIAIMAGGRDAVFAPSENVEDNFDAGRKDVDLACVTEKDCLMGISASGNARYVCGALKEASERGALTVGMICNKQGKISEFSQYMISVPTGAEVISGSTRMKAGTAQKMVLNMISTAVMVKLGKVTDNFMTWMTPTNQKLHAHKDGMRTSFDGEVFRYGRIGLSPSCPYTLEYLKEKYDTLLQKFGHHPSCKGVCLPAENTITITYDLYTREAYLKKFGEEMPSPDEMYADKNLENKVHQFIEDEFLQMYRTLASYIKEKYGLPLMHYPIDAISAASFFQPGSICNPRNISVMTRARELNLLNLQLHPPLYPDPYFFKFETEFLMANSDGIPCMADTHFYHEYAAGRVPDMTPKRNIDNILLTLTPNGISFFCYGFMAEELPMWKKELNPGAPVYKVYSEPHTLRARREMCLKAMNFVEILRPMMEGTVHTADLAIYYPEKLNADYHYSSYCTEHIFGLHELLNAAAIPTKVIAKIPESPEEQKALILDSVKSISEEDVEKLRIYLEKGGKLFVIGKCCEQIELVAGLRTELSDATFVVHEKSNEYNHAYFRIPTDGRHYTERNGEPMLRYGNGDPVFTRLGNVIYCGASDAVGRYGAYRDKCLAEYWKELLTKERLNSGVEFHNVYVNKKDGHQFTSCDLYKNDSKMLLLIRNLGVEHYHSSVTWELPEDMQVVKASLDGQELNFENGAELPVFEHFVAIYAERKNKDV